MFDQLLADIHNLPGDHDTKRRVAEMILSRYAGHRITISHQAARRQARDALLAQLRRAGYQPRDQVRVIIKRLGVSRSTAWQWVSNIND